MGQMADDVIEGFMCSHCGTCFEKEHGFSVLCTSCYDSESEEERAGLPRATLKEL
jgi:hypothetical protein